MCKGAAVMDDRGRKVAGAASIHDLDCLESKEQEEVEALATRKVLTFAHELGFQNVILEGDAFSLNQALKSQEQNLCPLGLLVEDVKVYSNHFRRVLYSHVKRNNNSVAHNLAKYVISIPDFQV
ncbi:hypothetical protein SO802_003185 [Lithocarpus litseifolius]|uniref:RNase H type-1 domain-containing protein n=1 Tax=Lithocarpus litseifolius TaxID=425828 RepID=A0AAW2E531_9ROSI